MNPQPLVTSILEIWQLVNSIMIWYIMEDDMIENIKKMWQQGNAQTITLVWTMIVHNLRGSYDTTRCHIQEEELQH